MNRDGRVLSRSSSMYKKESDESILNQALSENSELSAFLTSYFSAATAIDSASSLYYSDHPYLS